MLYPRCFHHRLDILHKNTDRIKQDRFFDMLQFANDDYQGIG